MNHVSLLSDHYLKAIVSKHYNVFDHERLMVQSLVALVASHYARLEKRQDSRHRLAILKRKLRSLVGMLTPRRILTLFISCFRYRRETLLRRFRDDFSFVPTKEYVNRNGKSTNHAHPSAANARCQATTSIDKFIKSAGHPRYDVATSRRELKFATDGERILYDDSDLCQEFKFDTLKRDHVVSMVDVDFHIDNWSRYMDNDVLMYTRIPDCVAGVGGDDSIYTIDCKDNGEVKLTEYINGGAVWSSGLWDFSRDRVIIKGKWGLSFSIVAVEKIPQPGVPGRYVVGLFPQVHVRLPYWLYSSVARWLTWGAGVTQCYPVLSHCGNVTARRVGLTGRKMVMGRFVSETKDMTSIRYADVQDASCAVLPTDTYLSLSNEMEVPKALSRANVEHRIRSIHPDEHYSSLASINKWAVFFSGTKIRDVDCYRTCNYVALGDNAYDSGKATCKQLAPAIVDHVSVSPTANSRNNDEMCVEERIVKIRNKTPFDSKLKSYANEFLNKMAKGKFHGSLHPVAREVVLENQTRPMQRARNEKYEKDGPGAKSKVKSFQKKEPYGDAKPPRNISTVQTVDTVEYARFMYAVKQHMAKHWRYYKWFMPCKKPAETAAAIHEYCSTRDEVVETDYSKFDGTISPDLRKYAEHNIYLALFAQEHHEELIKWMGRDMNMTGTTSTGLIYDTMSSRISGSQATTIGNTLVNAFVAYAAYRLGGASASEAWDRIGPKYGDDGIDDKSGDFTAAAEKTGLKIKIDSRSTINFVTFCGRYYLSPKTHTCSIFNPKKALQSLPVTVKSDVAAHEYKVRGYLSVDPKMPLISQYAKAIIRVNGYQTEVEGDLDFAKSIQTDHDLCRVLEGPFPYEETSHDMALATIADQLRISPLEVTKLIDDIDRVNTAEELNAIDKIKIPVETPGGVRFVSDDNDECIQDRYFGARNTRVRGRNRDGGRASVTSKPKLSTLQT